MTEGLKDDVSRPVRRVPCEVYSRIVGYLRPLQDWNKGKQQEFAERRMYVVPESALQSPDVASKASPSEDGGSEAGRRVEQQ